VTRLAQEVKGTAEGLRDLHDFLSGWRRQHVLVEDRGYRPYLLGSGEPRLG
jgi:hemerythrin